MISLSQLDWRVCEVMEQEAAEPTEKFRMEFTRDGVWP